MATETLIGYLVIGALAFLIYKMITKKHPEFAEAIVNKTKKLNPLYERKEVHVEGWQPKNKPMI